ncbi:uncharacterized protein [Argopecten irradians]|uniref:uncharacterized protein n=1 Tax=Argopecten irradians TaxID=31199 RepID=UPI0037198EED
MAGKFNGKPTWSKPMPVHGQGIVTFNITRNNAFMIKITKASTTDDIRLTIDLNSAEFGITQNGKYSKLAETAQTDSGYDAGRKISYWFSYNRDSLVFKYGKGYTMEETTELVYDFLAGARTPKKQEEIRQKYYGLFNAEDFGYVQFFDTTTANTDSDLIDIEKSVSFRKNPFIRNLSPFVLDSKQATLFTLDNGNYMLTGSLSPACKELYDNICNTDLNWPPEVDEVLLSDAIRFSIETKGCLLYQKLQEKAGEFGPGSGREETYLRVTLGHSLGNSPGIPYVLEIWPAKHYSPIHNHGNANAVIKVLFGQINVSLYNKQTINPIAKPVKTFKAIKGDVTWITRDWFQTHKLWNSTDDFCATIQCYSYDAGDTNHRPYFDYVSEHSTVEEFLPNSDFTFKYMRQNVLEEYRNKHGMLNPSHK